MKIFHTRYRALGPELIAVYRQSAAGRLPLLSARPAVTFPAKEHQRTPTSTNLYCFVTGAHRCDQLAQGCYTSLSRCVSRTYWSQVQRLTATPARHLYITPFPRDNRPNATNSKNNRINLLSPTESRINAMINNVQKNKSEFGKGCGSRSTLKPEIKYVQKDCSLTMLVLYRYVGSTGKEFNMCEVIAAWNARNAWKIEKKHCRFLPNRSHVQCVTLFALPTQRLLHCVGGAKLWGYRTKLKPPNFGSDSKRHQLQIKQD